MVLPVETDEAGLIGTGIHDHHGGVVAGDVEKGKLAVVLVRNELHLVAVEIDHFIAGNHAGAYPVVVVVQRPA